MIQETPLALAVAATAISSTANAATTGKYAAFPLGNTAWIQVNTLHFRFVTTATAGTRTPGYAVLDAQNNVIATGTSNNASQTASLTGNWSFGGGRTPNSQAIVYEGSLPDTLVIPPGSSVQFFERASIDVADTASLYMTYFI